jgi:hypothetical protein
MVRHVEDELAGVVQNELWQIARISLCFHCDVRAAIAYCNNSGGFSERFSIDPVEVPHG